MSETNSSNIHSTDPGRSFGSLERAAGWHYPTFLWRVLPTGIKDALRELRKRIVTAHV